LEAIETWQVAEVYTDPVTRRQTTIFVNNRRDATKWRNDGITRAEQEWIEAISELYMWIWLASGRWRRPVREPQGKEQDDEANHLCCERRGP
jgi:hypothetical protein